MLDLLLVLGPELRIVFNKPFQYSPESKTDVSPRSLPKRHEEQRKRANERELVRSKGAQYGESTKISKSVRRVQQIRGCSQWKTIGTINNRRGANTTTELECAKTIYI